MFIQLLIGFIIFPSSFCLLNADSTSWNRHPSVVKVLLKEIETSSVTTCTGTLISPNTVLTTSKCFMKPSKDYEGMAIISLPGTKKVMRKMMLEVRVDADVALLRIDPIHSENICERHPYPSAITRLNIKPTLSVAPFIPVETRDLEEKNCRVVGFQSETDENAESFGYSKIQFIELATERMDDVSMVSYISYNVTGTVCVSDYGAPLECDLEDNNIWVQVGMVNSVYTTAIEDNTENEEDTNESSKTSVKCNQSSAVGFYIFSDNSLPSSIEMVDAVGVFETAHLCS